MSTPDERDNDQVDEERERSAEQRNITAPTPKDVRAKGDDEDGDANEPPSTDG
ncbi:hypothetical protein [Streptacidiphilus anmyonensis]|uniref:hypothetical protein n=1 Tax=Streptacidiphilus anmyonensis TaxID=405782 RepID=UPI000AD10BDE|nr:hypothetical protein [Streptacidiphilus anmyonensis]